MSSPRLFFGIALGAVITLVCIAFIFVILRKHVIAVASEYPGATLIISDEQKLARFADDIGLWKFHHAELILGWRLKPIILRKLIIALALDRQSDGWTVDSSDATKVKSSYSFTINGMTGTIRIWLNPEYYDYRRDPDLYNRALSAKTLIGLHAAAQRLRGSLIIDALPDFTNDLYRGANDIIGEDYVMLRREGTTYE